MKIEKYIIAKEKTDLLSSLKQVDKNLIQEALKEFGLDNLEELKDCILEEFEMLYNGASVEEVESAIDKKEEEKRVYQEKAKREAIEEKKMRDLTSRIKNAEALMRAGVITKQEMENIKSEAEKELNALNKQIEEIDKNLAKSQNNSEDASELKDSEKAVESKDNGNALKPKENQNDESDLKKDSKSNNTEEKEDKPNKDKSDKK